MFTFRRSVLALALAVVSLPALAGSLPDISKLTKGQTTYQQVVDAFGRPAKIRRFADGHLEAFYAYNAPDPKPVKHGGFFHSLVSRVKATAKSTARGAINGHTGGLGAVTGVVDRVAGQAADNAIDKLGQTAQSHPQPASGVNNGTRCVLKFDTHSVFNGGYCAAQR